MLVDLPCSLFQHLLLLQVKLMRLLSDPYDTHDVEQFDRSKQKLGTNAIKARLRVYVIPQIDFYASFL